MDRIGDHTILEEIKSSFCETIMDIIKREQSMALAM
jgi:hypothetical protein